MVSKNWFGISILIVSSWALIATSNYDNVLESASYAVDSDCVSPAYVGNITISVDSITVPASTDFIDLGFPTATIPYDEDYWSGTYGSGTRTCELIYGDDESGDVIYNCKDDGNLTCSIVMTKN